MYSKRGLPYDRRALPDEKRLRANVSDLISRNQVSGARGAQLVNDISRSGARGVEGLCTSDKHLGNAPRFFRQVFRKNGWPPLYICKVRVWNLKTQTEEHMNVHMMLPHEILDRLAFFGHKDVLTSTSGLDDVSLEHMISAVASLDDVDTVPCGIWQDGVPCQWDRDVSAEMISLLLPGLPNKYKNLRVPITCVLKPDLSENTLDDIFEVVRWSFKQLAAKTWPSCRHDGTPFGPTDTWRKKKHGSLPVRGVLCQIKGDWKMFKEVLKLPGWQDEHICFQCNIRKDQVCIMKLSFILLLVGAERGEGSGRRARGVRPSPCANL